MKKSLFPLAACMFLSACGGSGTDHPDWARLNTEAARQYLEPIRPGYEGRNPFWNGFSRKFIYAPAFDFPQIDGAATYRFTVEPLGAVQGTAALTFTETTPQAALSPVWNDVPIGPVRLTVEALDAGGEVLGKAGEREFRRDYPFRGPYAPAARNYRQAAVMSLIYTHEMPQVQHWVEHKEPDLSYPHNAYPCKIIGATIRMEVLLAREVPAYRERAERIARNAAQFLIDRSRPADAPLAFFPPTYYGDLLASGFERNRGKTMTLEAVAAGQAFLDLYDLTGESSYFDRALGIADTYVALQRADGSLPIKVDFLTGEPVNEVCAMLDPLLFYFRRLGTQYGLDAYRPALAKAEEWMRGNALERFDMTGQFEDVRVEGLRPYENLTNCTAGPYASYLLTGDAPTAAEIAEAEALTRLCEDQFVYWACDPDAAGINPMNTPCVIEQYKYRTPVDNSACTVANALLDLYETTGDRICLEKARALVDNVTIVQNAVNGQIPTTWDFQKPARDRNRTYWINCSLMSVTTLLRMDRMTRPTGNRI